MKKKSKVEWLDRRLTQCAYYYCLCLSEKEYYAELKKLEVPPNKWNTFDGKGNAVVNHFKLDDGKCIAIVCMDGEIAKTKSGPQVACLLVHEAVHIWQRHAVEIGSFNDHGDEEEAYAIQGIAQSLMEEYTRRMF
jgi:hypothetical protein